MPRIPMQNMTATAAIFLRRRFRKIWTQGVPYVIRQNIPAEGSDHIPRRGLWRHHRGQQRAWTIRFSSSRDGLPTYNFANVVDDHLMGITHVVRGSEYLSSAPKYNLLYEAFGWEIPTYVHCASVMITDPETGNVRKMSKRHGDPSYEDLADHGLSVSGCDELCGPFGLDAPEARLAEQEFFTLDELCKAFDIAGISKSPCGL